MKRSDFFYEVCILVGRGNWEKDNFFPAKLAGRCVREVIVNCNISNWYVSQILSANNLSGKGSTKLFISFDCDLEEDVRAYPEIVEKMKGFDIRGSFACVGKYVEKFPDEHRVLVEAGHEIMNHTMTHPHHRVLNPNRRFNQLSGDEMRREIEDAHEVIMDVLGVECVGFRSPHFGNLHTRRVYRLLHDLDYQYSSSTIGTRTPSLGDPFEEDGILEIPLTSSLKNAFTCPETWALQRSPHRRYADIDEYIKELETILDWGLGNVPVLNFYFDPCDMIAIRGLADRVFGLIREYDDRATIMQYRDYQHS